jgi:hypothetical protein
MRKYILFKLMQDSLVRIKEEDELKDALPKTTS